MKYTRMDIKLKTDRYRLYVMYRNMIRRCVNPSGHNYNQYGGKGISVVGWKGFEDFYEWAIKNGYRHGLQIDRKDSDLNYCPPNCRFVTPDVNQKNKKSYKGSFSRYKNVYKNGNKFCARLSVNGKMIFVGNFNNEIDAAIARDNYIKDNYLPDHTFNFQ